LKQEREHSHPPVTFSIIFNGDNGQQEVFSELMLDRIKMKWRKDESAFLPGGKNGKIYSEYVEEDLTQHRYFLNKRESIFLYYLYLGHFFPNLNENKGYYLKSRYFTWVLT